MARPDFSRFSPRNTIIAPLASLPSYIGARDRNRRWLLSAFVEFIAPALWDLAALPPRIRSRLFVFYGGSFCPYRSVIHRCYYRFNYRSAVSICASRRRRRRLKLRAADAICPCCRDNVLRKRRGLPFTPPPPAPLSLFLSSREKAGRRFVSFYRDVIIKFRTNKTTETQRPGMQSRPRRWWTIRGKNVI